MIRQFPLKKAGFTLVELMVGMALSLILMAAVFIVYVSSTQTNRTSRGMLSAQSDVQLAMNFLKEDIARTGWANNQSAGYSLPSPLPANFASFDGGGSVSDSISVHFESCDSADASNNCLASGVDSADCNGVAVTAGSIITNTYVVNSDKELTCNGQPFIDNVENFQVLYGQLTTNGIEYVSANNITNVSAIHSIRFGLIVSSETDTSDSVVKRDIVLLDQTINSEDRRLRLKYETSVVVLNKPLNQSFGI